MESKLFLTGPSGCGKSTMIKNALGDTAALAGGFVTERITDCRGRITAFELRPASAVRDGAFRASRFLDCSGASPKTDTAVFKIEAVRLLREAETHPFALIDEVGGFELLIPEFREAFSEFLSSPCPCIGVFKGAPNSESLRKTLNLDDGFLSWRQCILNEIKKNRDIKIIETTGRYDRYAINSVNEWCRQFAALA